MFPDTEASFKKVNTSRAKLGILRTEEDLARLPEEIYLQQLNRSQAATARLSTPRDPDVNLIGSNSEASLIPPKVYFEPPSRVQLEYLLVQYWEGYVTKISDSHFCARLTDPKTKEAEDAQILKSELAEDDLPLLVEGGVFYWSIGRLRSHSGRPQLISE
jgi:hypothetical protein